jgi:hypothetical protein
LEDLTGFRKRLQAIITPYSIDFAKDELYENLSGLIGYRSLTVSRRFNPWVLWAARFQS